VFAVFLRIAIVVAGLMATGLAEAAGPGMPRPKVAQIDTSPRMQSASRRNLRLASEAPQLPQANGDVDLFPEQDSFDPQNGFHADGVSPAGMFYNSTGEPEEVLLPEAVEPQPYLEEAAPGYADPTEWGDENYWQQQEPPVPVTSSSTWFNRGRWYAKQDFVYMNRFSTESVPLAADYTLLRPISSIPYVAINSPSSLGFEPGMRMTLGRFLCQDMKHRDHTLEFTFTGLFDWQQSASLTARAPGSIFSLLDPFRTTSVQVPAFNESNALAYTYNSSFDSYEINYLISQRLGRDRLELQPNGEWIRTLTSGHVSAWSAGVRLITIGEGFNLASQGIDPTTENGLYEVATQNDLLGVHFGYEFTYQRPKLRVGLKSRVGAFINYAEQQSYVRIVAPQNAPPDRIEHATAHDVALVLDLSLMAAYHIRPNISLRAGYDFMFINQLALAPEQLTFNPGPVPSIVNGGALTLNAFTLGVELVW
jgi:hypothetical protein